jgi:hypothetical protein
MSAMLWVQRHYSEVAKETRLSTPLQIKYAKAPIVIVPVQSWSLISQRAVEFALTLSTEIYALHVGTEEEIQNLQKEWKRLVADPVTRAGGTPPILVTLESPYRMIIKPILDYVVNMEIDHPDRQIAVIVAELVERHWYHYLLHNQRAELLKALLLVRGERIVLVNVPWHLKA